jgi:short-subunit dehydrogenase
MKRSRSAFAGKRILLTGAGSGIGQACALQLARQGAQLALVDIDADKLNATAKEARAAGSPVSLIVADLASPQAVERVAREAVEQLGGIDILFSNAGVAVVKPMVETSSADWEWIFNINLWATIRLARALVPEMVARRSGQLVFTASLAGLVAAPGMVAYSTTKFALVGFAEALRLELAGSGVDITVACPGFVRTNLHQSTRYANEGFARLMDAPPGWYGLTKERAAARILDAVASRRALIALGPERIGWWLKRAWPAAHFATMRWLASHFNLLPRSDRKT